MEELFRYTQVRQTEKLSGEQKRLTGLTLYPDDKLSPLASDLVAINTGHSADATASGRVAEHARDEGLIEDVSDLPAPIRAVYDWLQFKARPIRVADFSDIIASLKLDDVDLTDAWTRYADSLVVAIYRGQASINGCIDYQLLIRICHLFRLCVVVNAGTLQLKDDTSADLVSAVLEHPILLPAQVLRSRCSADCHDKGQATIPHLANLPEGRGERSCECTCDDSCQDPSNHCICINTYVADLFIIKEKLARFEEGDIADIENVLAGEEKVRRHRYLYRTEVTTEQEQETLTSEERDHQVSEKFSLQDEVKSTIDSKVGIDAGVTSTVKYGEVVTITPHANVTANFSKSQAESIARSYAKEIVDRSVSKVQEKTRRLQVSKIISEVEERNKHKIDNTDPAAMNRAGLYYWVNRVSHAQVFNYGKHMMFDAVLPEPAALFKKLYQDKIQLDKDRNEPPKANRDAFLDHAQQLRRRAQQIRHLEHRGAPTARGGDGGAGRVQPERRSARRQQGGRLLIERVQDGRDPEGLQGRQDEVRRPCELRPSLQHQRKGRSRDLGARRGHRAVERRAQRIPGVARRDRDTAANRDVGVVEYPANEW